MKIPDKRRKRVPGIMTMRDVRQRLNASEGPPTIC